MMFTREEFGIVLENDLKRFLTYALHQRTRTDPKDRWPYHLSGFVWMDRFLTWQRKYGVADSD